MKYTELVPYVQAAPDQGETATCWFMASTGALELLMNKKHKIKNPRKNGPYDLSESFLIWQSEFKNKKRKSSHFLEDVIRKFNFGEGVLNKHWPYRAKNKDGSENEAVWDRHPEFEQLPRISVPALETELLFARGSDKWATGVLGTEDVTAVKKALLQHRSPVIINYNDDGFWHVILIVGYDDSKKGVCYEITPKECNKKGAFIVRDSDGKRTEARAYNWFTLKANAAAVVRFR
ncbi:MAG TPA: hypothetical protein VNJ01_07745 [Bacteriovoracaceae bacterium]|nr:hypothetical protein [Bacteriovoracaceae bacterium]